jgi:hypothetical protein
MLEFAKENPGTTLIIVIIALGVLEASIANVCKAISNSHKD